MTASPHLPMAHLPATLAVEPSGPVDATIPLPGSKSITNRALVCAALAPGQSHLRNALDADDTEAMIEALHTLGVPVAWDGDDTLRVGAATPGGEPVIVDARSSGTTSRFLLPVLALGTRKHRLVGTPQLEARPMGPSLEALRALGAVVQIDAEPDRLPVTIQGPLKQGSVTLSGGASSQFLSGLLLAAPAIDGGLSVRIEGELISRPYVDMTVAVMEAFGGQVSQPDADQWDVAGTGYAGTDYRIEPDASGASYAWAAAILTGGAVTVEGLSADSIQGDVAVVDVFEAMGARVRRDGDAITVAAGDELNGVDVDMSDISDMVMTVAVVAARASNRTRIRNVGFIRRKESDRIGGVVAELRRCGIGADETEDGLTIEPAPLQRATVQTYDDHRMAMAFALLGLSRPGIEIADPACVAKTFPGYWHMIDELRTGILPPARPI